MKRRQLLIDTCGLATITLMAGVAPLQAATSSTPKIRTLTWDDLLPESERNAPPTNLPSARTYKLFGDDDSLPPQIGSTAVNKQLAGQLVKIPGYVVPLDVRNNKVQHFFLVPYYGACIHVPPPPPNQMVYVELAQAMPINKLYEAQWVTGPLTLKTQSNQIATATYTIKATSVETYKEP